MNLQLYRAVSIEAHIGIKHPQLSFQDPTLCILMREQDSESRTYMLTNSLPATYAAVVAGTGLAVLPCYPGDPDERLCRVEYAPLSG